MIPWTMPEITLGVYPIPLAIAALVWGIRRITARDIETATGWFKRANQALVHVQTATIIVLVAIGFTGIVGVVKPIALVMVLTAAAVGAVDIAQNHLGVIEA